MPAPQPIRPQNLSPDKRKELERYLLDHYDRATRARDEQLQDKFRRWQDIYYGRPFEKIRNTPWYKSSNFVVKLVRMFADTFLARTLNIMFATRPLYSIEGFPREVREGLEYYFNLKAIRDWNHYTLAKEMILRGNKNGTAPVKTIYKTDDLWTMSASADAAAEGQMVTVYDGPFSRVIPFADWNCYPITVNSLEDVRVQFHRLRYVEEAVRQKVDSGKWSFMDDQHGDMIKAALAQPNDVKRLEDQEAAGINYLYNQEVQVVECSLNWAITNDSDRYYPIVGVIVPKINKLVDVYFDPYPPGTPRTTLYRPFPKEDLIFGESICELLDQTQEEASAIHNDRRNNSTLANSVMFKRRSGSTTPNPSTNWYPGKVWDVESLDDLEIINEVGRNYTDMINEEQFSLSLGSQLTGIDEAMRGVSAGAEGKKGGYSAGGTLGVMAEGNQRQDTNVRDVRLAMSEIARVSWVLQKEFGQDDPVLATLPPEMQSQVRQAFSLSTPERIRASWFEARASDAGANKEIHKQNLMMMAQTLGQYGQQVLQLEQQKGQFQGPAAQVMVPIIEQIEKMMSGMAHSILRAFDETELEELLPDVNRQIGMGAPGSGQPGGGLSGSGPGAIQGPPGGPPAGMEPGGGGGPTQPLSLQGLQALAALSGKGGGNAPGAVGGS